MPGQGLALRRDVTTVRPAAESALPVWAPGRNSPGDSHVRCTRADPRRQQRQRRRSPGNHEWLDALQGVLNAEGTERAAFLIDKQIEYARVNGEPCRSRRNAVHQHHPGRAAGPIPGDQDIEHRIRSYTRWNAMAMVLRANKHTNVGGHISSFASAATLYDVGFNHFWHAPSDRRRRPVFVQGHSAPGVYSRAFLLGRLTKNSSTTSARKWTARASRRTRTRG
jgi:pyruvate dehydrogenase complex dehydrogenase (E1) component